jgi:4-amino-4-deoxy-L-arabinose transferase-like glycosyltransferase
VNSTLPLPAIAAEPPKLAAQKLSSRDRRLRYLISLAFIGALTGGIGLRLWKLGVSPAWQWDESVYWRVAVNIQHGLLTEHPLRGMPWSPFLYQPPFYLLVLARWFGLTGATIYHARLLGVALTAVTLLVLFRLLWRIHGPGVALFAVTPVIFDGWLLYIGRVSYIENALMVLVVGAFLLYQRALERPSWHRFAIAGGAIGTAAIFKQTGAYVLVASMLCWLIIRRSHKGHLMMLGVALAIIGTYVIAMTRMYNVPGHPWFTTQSLVQVTRVLGLRQSGGTLTSPGKLLHLLEAQYGVFIPSLLAAFAALLIAARRLIRCYRARSWLPARGNALIFAWLVTGIVVFGLSSLKFPQYFELILIPAYCYLWTELARWDWRNGWKGAALAAATLAGLGTFAQTIPAYGYNTLAQVQRYAATRIPSGSTVVTEQTIGDLIQQPWCTVEYAVPCELAARQGLATPMYAITWRTYLQSSFKQGDPAFLVLMKGAVRITSFSGAVGTATIWKLMPMVKPGR